MKKYLVIVLAFLLGATVVIAAPIAQHLIDSKPGEGVLVGIDQFSKEHPVTKPVQLDTIFTSPRAVVNLLRISGPFIGRHIHTETDEIIYLYKGKCEVFLNGKWVSMKPGDLHVCPRGIAHAIRAVDKEGFEAIAIFTQPTANDKVMIDD